MKTVFKYAFLLLILTVIYQPGLLAQSTSLSGVYQALLRNSGEIIENDEIKGYYYFYQTDKISKKEREYTIKILDANLNAVATEKIIGNIGLYLVEASFNGENFLFKFYDTRESKVTIQVRDKAAKLKYETVTEISSKIAKLYYVPNANDEIQGTSVFAVPNKGFIVYNPIETQKVGYSIEFFSNEGKDKGWIKKSSSTNKEYEVAQYLAADEHIILNAVNKQSSLKSKNATLYISGVDTKSGKQLFEQKLVDSQYQLLPTDGYINPSGQMVVFGQYYLLKDNIMKSQSTGLFSLVVDKSGNILFKNYVSWTKDISKFFPSNAKGKLKDIGYIYFHNIIKTADGKVFAIGEQYKKVASGGGIAGAILAGGTKRTGVSLVKIVVDDLFLFEFTPDFKLKDVKIFDKTKNNVELPAGTGFRSRQMLANTIKYYGAFDYYYTQRLDQGKSFTIGYLDYDKKNRSFGALTYFDGEFSQDKIKLGTDATRLWVLPAKPGYVLISEYYRKSKKLNIHLEKINF